MNKNIKTEIAIGIIIVIAIIIGGLIWFSGKQENKTPAKQPVTVQNKAQRESTQFSQQNDISTNRDVLIDTTDWKIYENKKYNLKFQYPQEAIIKFTDRRDDYQPNIEVKLPTGETIMYFSLIMADGNNGPGPELNDYKSKFFNLKSVCPSEDITTGDSPYLNEINYGKFTTIHNGCTDFGSNKVIFNEISIEQARKEIESLTGENIPSNYPNRVAISKNGWLSVNNKKIVGIRAGIYLDDLDGIFTPRGSLDPITGDGKLKLDEIIKNLDENKFDNVNSDKLVKYFDKIFSTLTVK